MTEGFHREGQPFDVTFSRPFFDDRESKPEPPKESAEHEKSLGEREHERQIETGLSFTDEVRDVVVRGEKKRTEQRGLFDRLKTHSLMLASALGISAGSFAMLDSETRQNVVENVRELMAAAQFGNAEQQELAAQAKMALSKDLKDLQHDVNDVNKEAEMRKKLVDLHMKVLELKGGISHEEVTKTREYIEQLVTKYQKMHKESFKNDRTPQEDIFSELFELSKETGRYQSGKARVSSIANEGVGNCESKALLRRLVVPFVYPGSELKFQHFGAGEKTSPDQGPTDSAGHVRMIMKIQGSWYALEDGVPQKLSPEDLVGTQITDIDVYEKSLLGENIAGKPVKSEGAVARESTAQTNSLFNLQFDSPPTRSAPGASSVQVETLEAFKKRQRLEYTAAGQTLDPENLPPLKVYIGETLEDVASKMGGGEKKEDELKPEDPHELPEDMKMRAMIDGELNLGGGKVFYDLSPLYGVDLKKIQGNFGRMTGKVGDKYAQEFAAHFSKVSKIHFGRMNEGVKSIFSAFDSPENVDIASFDGEEIDLNFLTKKDSIKQFSLKTWGTVDLEPLGGHHLQTLRLSNHIAKEAFKNLNAIDTSTLEAIAIGTRRLPQGTEQFIAGAPIVREFQLYLGTQEGENFKILDSVKELKTKTLEKFSLTIQNRPIEGEFTFDLTKISSQPLKALEIWGISAQHLEALQGMPLEKVSIEINCDTTDISPLKNLSKLRDLEVICNGDIIPSEVENFVLSLPIETKVVRRVGQPVEDDQDYITQMKLGVGSVGGYYKY